MQVGAQKHTGFKDFQPPAFLEASKIQDERLKNITVLCLCVITGAVGRFYIERFTAGGFVSEIAHLLFIILFHVLPTYSDKGESINLRHHISMHKSDSRV